jgi:hypothetical protein
LRFANNCLTNLPYKRNTSQNEKEERKFVVNNVFTIKEILHNMKKPNLSSAQKSRPVRSHLGGANTSPQHKTKKQKGKYCFWENVMNASQSNKELDS